MAKEVMAVRGAVSVPHGTDEVEGMVEALGRLLGDLTRFNGIAMEDIISIQCTQTADLRRKNAAAALREFDPQYGRVPLFCSQEPAVEGSIPGIVRILLTYRGLGIPQHVYLDEAAALRPDLAGGSA